MEWKLRSDSEENYKKTMQASVNSMQKLFNSRANKFDGEFYSPEESENLEKFLTLEDLL